MNHHVLLNRAAHILFAVLGLLAIASTITYGGFGYEWWSPMGCCSHDVRGPALLTAHVILGLIGIIAFFDLPGAWREPLFTPQIDDDPYEPDDEDVQQMRDLLLLRACVHVDESEMRQILREYHAVESLSD